MQQLVLRIPKGSLENTTVDMIDKAGYKIKINQRSYYPSINDDEMECMLIRAQEMARYVEDGILDCGLTGKDWILETGSDVVEVCELVYSKVGRKPLRRVLAAPENGNVQKPEDLEGKIIATEAVGMTKKYLKEKDISTIIGMLPALEERPTVSKLAEEEGWLALNTIIDENIVRDIIPELLKRGAHGIVEYPLN